jgi:transposase
VNEAASVVDQRLLALEAKLAQFVADAAAQLSKVQSERDEYRKLVLHLREENERLKRGLLGQKAERLPRNDAQLELAILAMAMGGTSAGQGHASAPEKRQIVPQHSRCKPRRGSPSEDLPRVEFEVIPPEVEREGLNAFELIGEERRSVLERRPSSNVVVDVVYKKFVRKEHTPPQRAVPPCGPQAAVPAVAAIASASGAGACRPRAQGAGRRNGRAAD